MSYFLNIFTDSDTEISEDLQQNQDPFTQHSPVTVKFDGEHSFDWSVWKYTDTGANQLDESDDLDVEPEQFVSVMDVSDETEELERAPRVLEDHTSPPKVIKRPQLIDRVVGSGTPANAKMDVSEKIYARAQVVTYGNPEIVLTKRGTRKSDPRDQIKCLCGGIYRRSNGTKHRQSVIHRKFLKMCERNECGKKARTKPQN